MSELKQPTDPTGGSEHTKLHGKHAWIEYEGESIRRAGQLHWFHWAIVAASLGLTIVAWQYSKKQIELRVEARFEQEAKRIPELIDERMELYENALWAGVAQIEANGGDVPFEDWKVFSESLRLGKRYPGINGIGVVDSLPREALPEYLARHRAENPDYRVHPEHQESQLWPIRLVVPLATNAKAVGLDMAHEVNRRTAAEKARDTGRAQITGPIVLVQDSAKTPGFLFYAPLHKDQQTPTDEPHVLSLVYAPFIMSKLMAGTMHKDSRNIAIQISDAGTVLYDEHDVSDPNNDPNPLYSKAIVHNVYGRNWEFDIRTTRSFRGGAGTGQSQFILAIGIFIDALLLTLFTLISRANRRAMAFTRRVTAELRERSTSLERSNEDLEKFAYVASHDLKTPLRGISDLREYLEEDLEEYLETGESRESVKRNLDRMEVQVHRMTALIAGILQYSSVGATKVTSSEVNLSNLVERTMTDLGIGPERWTVAGEPEAFSTDAVQFEQIVTNLLTNAVKYHDDVDALRIDVSIQDNGESYKLTFEDNGPGIAPRFHDRIFEAFQTLQPKDEIEGTGIGLAIVKKTLEGLGQTISVRSEVGEGATFEFTWPKHFDFEIDE